MRSGCGCQREVSLQGRHLLLSEALLLKEAPPANPLGPKDFSASADSERDVYNSANTCL